MNVQEEEGNHTPADEVDAQSVGELSGGRVGADDAGGGNQDSRVRHPERAIRGEGYQVIVSAKFSKSRRWRSKGNWAGRTARAPSRSRSAKIIPCLNHQTNNRVGQAGL